MTDEGNKTSSTSGSSRRGMVMGGSSRRTLWGLVILPLTALLLSNHHTVSLNQATISFQKEATTNHFSGSLQTPQRHNHIRNSNTSITSSSNERPVQPPNDQGSIKEALTSPKTNQPFPQSPAAAPTAADAAATTTTVVTRKSRILLGIFFAGDAEQLRNVHRKTYLNYFAKHHTSTPNRTCTLREFEALLQRTKNTTTTTTSTNPLPTQPEWDETCRFVYTFVLEGTETWHRQRRNIVLTREPDVLVLDPKLYPLPESSSSSLLIPPPWVRWYQFAMDQQLQWAKQQQDQVNSSVVDGWSYFDFVAHTDCSVQLHPEEFWRDNPFLNAELPGNRSQVFAQGDQFTLLSTDLVQNIVVPYSKNATTNMTADSGDNVTDWLTYILGRAVDLPHSSSSSTATASAVTRQPLLGMTRDPKENWLDLVIMWDEYKDQKLQESGGYSNPQEAQQIQSSKAYEYLRSTNHTLPRILVGIFSMDSPKDRIRRDTIRETYLSYYNKESNHTPHRICALNDIFRGILSLEQAAQCQLAYAFVMGSNPNGTKSLLEPSPSNPIVVDDKDVPSHLWNETDIVHLNIAENMEEGKSPTWIRFATDVIYDQFHFDYIAKMDSDTLLYPDEFLDDILTPRCPPFPDNIRVYGGGAVFLSWHYRMVGPMYMSGRLYWISPDLGRFITSPEFQEERESVDSHAEDWAMGNFVHSHPWPIRRVLFQHKHEGHRHPVKEPDRMSSLWMTYLKDKGIPR